MDITSPLVVVPVIVCVFFTCILWATRSGSDTHQSTGSSTGRTPDSGH